MAYEPSVYDGDIPHSLLEMAKQARMAALDIETTGLSWENSKIATCQLYVPNRRVAIMRVNGSFPHNLGLLLENRDICKVFHHAVFDLRFMAYNWPITVSNVVCTKIASKILSPTRKSHSLKALVGEYLGIQLDKSMQTSNWLAEQLSQEQLKYAAEDVLYLPDLFRILQGELEHAGRWPLAKASFDYLPTRVRLDILGSGDVFTY